MCLSYPSAVCLREMACGFDAESPRLAAAEVTVCTRATRCRQIPILFWIGLDGERAVGEKFLQDPEVETVMQEAGVLALPEFFCVD